jgi:hypothetical protein
MLVLLGLLADRSHQRLEEALLFLGALHAVDPVPLAHQLADGAAMREAFQGLHPTDDQHRFVVVGLERLPADRLRRRLSGDDGARFLLFYPATT